MDRPVPKSESLSEECTAAVVGLVSDERWRQRVRATCFRLLGGTDDAADAAQESFRRILTATNQLRDVSLVRPWAWRIVLNSVRDHHRRQSRSTARTSNQDEGVPAADELPPDVQASASEEADRVRGALALLSPVYREVVVLRHYEQLKFREIAEILQIPEGTAASRMAAGLTALAEILNPCPS